MVDAWRNAIVLGAVAALYAAFAPWRRAGPVLGVLLGVGLVVAFVWGIVDRAWVFGSVVRDAPWLPALVLAAWSLHAGTGWLRVRTWALVVPLAALAGDVFVATGLAVAEPDPRRRARLVLAASGASLLGRTGGGASLVLGWGGVEVALLGLACAALGFVGGGGAGVERAPVALDPRPFVFVLGGALATWLATVGGGLELLALGLESLPLFVARWHAPLLAGAAALAGAGFDEGVLALDVGAALDRALSLRDDHTRQILVAGLSIGGGLPLLVWTRSALRVGLPLWSAQVLLLLLFAAR